MSDTGLLALLGALHLLTIGCGLLLVWPLLGSGDSSGEGFSEPGGPGWSPGSPAEPTGPPPPAAGPPLGMSVPAARRLRTPAPLRVILPPRRGPRHPAPPRTPCPIAPPARPGGAR